MGKRINIFFSFLVALYFLFIYYYSALSLENISWVGFFSNDNIYLLEQFILKIKGYEFEKNFNSGQVEYGIEFYILKNIFNFLNINKIISNKVYYLYIISIIHIFSSIISIIYIKKILNFFNIKKILQVIFLVIFFSLPTIIEGVAALKPDANIVLTFIIISFYFHLQFLQNKSFKDYFLSIFFLTFAASIKFWGFFLLPAYLLSYIILKEKKIIPNKYYLLINISSIFIFFYIIKKFTFFIYEEYLITENIKNLGHYNLISLKFSFVIETINFLTINENLYLIFSVILFFLVYLLIKCTRNINFKYFISTISIFFIIWFLISFEFILDHEKFLKSNFYFFLNSLYLPKNFITKSILNYFFDILVIVGFFIGYLKFPLIKKNIFILNLYMVFLIFFILYLGLSRFAGGVNIYLFFLLLLNFVLIFTYFDFIRNFILKNLSMTFVFIIIFLCYNLNIFYLENSNKKLIVNEVEILFKKYKNYNKYFCNHNFPTTIFVKKNFKVIREEDCEKALNNTNILDNESIFIINSDFFIKYEYLIKNSYYILDMVNILQNNLEKFKNSKIDNKIFYIIKRIEVDSVF